MSKKVEARPAPRKFLKMFTTKKPPYKTWALVRDYTGLSYRNSIER
jgi:hypothetical protein